MKTAKPFFLQNNDGQKLSGLSFPKKPNDAATKKYVDNLIADNVGEGNTSGGGSPFFKENGNYQALYAINMGFKKLLNLSTPSEPFDAATKKYVDETATNVVEKRTHMIAVNASYHGDLIKDDYQFTFGGNSVKTGKTNNHRMYIGFLILHSGYIKRLTFQCTGFKLLVPSDGLSKFNTDLIRNQPLPLFTLVLIKRNDEIVELGTLNIILKKFYSEDNSVVLFPFTTDSKGNRVEGYDYSFTSNLPGGIEEYEIDVKDILNIRLEFTNVHKEEKNETIQIFLGGGYIEPEEFFTYLTTILIELDPLE